MVKKKKKILTSNAAIEDISVPFIFTLQGELLIIVNWLFPFSGKIGYAPYKKENKWWSLR